MIMLLLLLVATVLASAWLLDILVSLAAKFWAFDSHGS